MVIISDRNLRDDILYDSRKVLKTINWGFNSWRLLYYVFEFNGRIRNVSIFYRLIRNLDSNKRFGCDIVIVIYKSWNILKNFKSTLRVKIKKYSLLLVTNLFILVVRSYKITVVHRNDSRLEKEKNLRGSRHLGVCMLFPLRSGS